MGVGPRSRSEVGGCLRLVKVGMGVWFGGSGMLCGVCLFVWVGFVIVVQ